ncbi:glycosyltransferase family 4 protein [bacterium]|nr:glycosyltransferase family 4 protein [bacterium]
MDLPNSRSSHRLPTPSGGGIAFISIAYIWSILSFFTDQYVFHSLFYFLVLPLAVVGLIDDRYKLPAIWRYVFQFFTAIALLGFSPLIHALYFTANSIGIIFFLICIFLLIVITAVINFTNFMDGLDGLVAGCMVVLLGVLSTQLSPAWSSCALSGAVFGFLIWNWSPAKVFMGDVGSTFLGAVFIGLVFQLPTWSQALSMLLVATPLLADAFFCVLRRWLAGQRVFTAHRLHLFQRLHQTGWSHTQVSSLYTIATLALSVSLIVGGLPLVIGFSIFIVLIGFYLDQRVAVPFCVASLN